MIVWERGTYKYHSQKWASKEITEVRKQVGYFLSLHNHQELPVCHFLKGRVSPSSQSSAILIFWERKEGQRGEEKKWSKGNVNLDVPASSSFKIPFLPI